MWVPRWVLNVQYNFRMQSLADKWNRDRYRIEEWIRLGKGSKKEKVKKWSETMYQQLLSWIDKQEAVRNKDFWDIVKVKDFDGYMIFYLLEMLRFLSLDKYLRRFKDMEPQELKNHKMIFNEIVSDMSDDDRKALKELGKKLKKGSRK